MSGPFYLGQAEYRVTAPLAVVELQSGERVYLYRDSLLPADVVPAQVERLVREGLIEQIEAVA